MILDARDIEPGREIAAQDCIVGAGAAGIALARALAKQGRDVLLLESGGLAPDAATTGLQQGSSSGQAYPPLEATRSRFFGGSTNCWEGYCRPLESIDFERRAWVPHSGWPFGRAELVGHYARAARELGLGPLEDRRRAEDDDAAAALGEVGLRHGLFRFGTGPARFGPLHRDGLEREPRIRVMLHANVTRIALDRDGARVAGLEVRSLGRAPFRVRPARSVIAAGGIENARLLLVSDDVHPTGVGNRHDLVGRFFMEHPHLRYQADLVAHTPSRLSRYERVRVDGFAQRAILQPTDAWLRATESLHFGLQLRPLEGHGIKPFMLKLADATRSVDGWGAASGPVEAPRLFGLVMHHEQAPNPRSRVTLGDERDALGLRRAHLHWALGELDRASAGRAHRLAARALAAAGLGRSSVLLPESGAWPGDMVPGNHHMGTTRMAASPREGVVDADARVHGVANLWIAGSSVFPTSGAANPTLTLLALTLRLADHLAGEAQ